MDLHIAASIVPLLGWAVHGGILTRRLACARRDPLTGLPTRAGWTARAEHLIRRHPNAAVLLVDLDQFKTLNDTHGHASGDAALVRHRRPAARLVRTQRRSWPPGRERIRRRDPGPGRWRPRHAHSSAAPAAAL
ncbi:diguanylate cyclase domain-containing protein [Streptomyces massasporeus]